MTRDLPVSPTPGQPLRAEDLGLLVKGDLVAPIADLTDYGGDVQKAGVPVAVQSVSGDFIRTSDPDKGHRYNVFQFVSRPGRLVSAEPDRAEGGEGVTHRQASHHASTASTPLTNMLRDIDERLNRDSPDIPGARVTLHGARLAVAYNELSSSPSQEQAPATPATEPGGERGARVCVLKRSIAFPFVAAKPELLTHELLKSISDRNGSAVERVAVWLMEGKTVATDFCTYEVGEVS